jgi:hypothetical protein
MKHHQTTRWPIFLFTALFLISLSAFSTNEGNIDIDCPSGFAKGKKAGPPNHAKAHGYRAKHTYRYYPSANAYYDVERKAYFYLEGDNWRMGVCLPDTLSLRLGKYVTIEIDSDKPYTRFEEHKRQYLTVK